MSFGKTYIHKEFDPLEKIGEGNFSDVYRSYSRKHDKTVIIKRIDKLNKMTRIDDVLAEISILSYLKCMCQKHTICFLDFMEDERYFYIITEYLSQYVTLSNFVNQTARLDNTVLITIIENLKNGLIFLHKHGITHRDIKPDNILIDPSSLDVRYIDFGLSCRLDVCHSPRSVGTPLYQAPELIIESDQLTQGNRLLQKLVAMKPNTLIGWIWADYWSLGMTILEMMTKNQIMNQLGQLMLKHQPNEKTDLQQIIVALSEKGKIDSLFNDCCRSVDPEIHTYLRNSVRPLINLSPNMRAMFVTLNRLENDPKFTQVNTQLDL
jgi:serine/threonine protein kinase